MTALVRRIWCRLRHQIRPRSTHRPGPDLDDHAGPDRTHGLGRLRCLVRCLAAWARVMVGADAAVASEVAASGTDCVRVGRACARSCSCEAVSGAFDRGSVPPRGPGVRYRCGEAAWAGRDPVGGLMAQLHGIYRGIDALRPTDDVDIVVHVETTRLKPSPGSVGGSRLDYGTRSATVAAWRQRIMTSRLPATPVAPATPRRGTGMSIPGRVAVSRRR